MRWLPVARVHVQLRNEPHRRRAACRVASQTPGSIPADSGPSCDRRHARGALCSGCPSLRQQHRPEWVATTRDVTEKRFQSVLGGRPSRGSPDTTLAAAHSLLILRSPGTAWCAPIFGRSATRHTPSSGGDAFMSIASASCASGQMPFGAAAPTIRPQQFLHRPPEPHSSLLNSTQPDVAQFTEPHRNYRASDDGIDAESSGSKQGPPQAATTSRMTPLQD